MARRLSILLIVGSRPDPTVRHRRRWSSTTAAGPGSRDDADRVAAEEGVDRTSRADVLALQAPLGRAGRQARRCGLEVQHEVEVTVPGLLVELVRVLRVALPVHLLRAGRRRGVEQLAPHGP